MYYTIPANERQDIRDELIQLTTDMVRFASTEDCPDQLVAITDYVEAYVRSIPGVFVHRSETHGKPALVATLHDTHTPTIFFNGHLDVVPADPAQFTPIMRDNRIYGRGCQDMKGGVAVLLRLLRDAAQLSPLPNVGIQCVTDEEIGGDYGTGQLIADGWECDCFIATEPTDLRICYEQKGIIWAEVVSVGITAHGSHPWEGNNPLYALARGLQTLEQRFPVPTTASWLTTVTPTSLATDNTPINQIPAYAWLKLDIRYIPGEERETVLHAVRDCFPGATLTPITTSVPMHTDPTTPMVQRLAYAVQHITGQPAILYREHFGSDGRFYSMQNIPAVCFGPTGAGLHSPNEWVDIESLVDCHAALLTFLAGVCG